MACAKIIVLTSDDHRDEIFHSALDDKYHVAVYHDSEEGIKAIREQRPALAIIDLLIAHNDGIEVLEQLSHTNEIEDTMFLLIADMQIEETLPDEFWRKHFKVDAFISSPITSQRIRSMVEHLFIKKINPRNIVGPGFF